MILSNFIVSKDIYFTYGLCRLLGLDFIEGFYNFLDFDDPFLEVYAKKYRVHNDNNKEIIAFVSNDIGFYKASRLGITNILDKSSQLRDILGFFLLRRNSCLYKVKSRLTAREMEILYLISDGATNSEVIDTLGIKYKTFYTHRRNLVLKLGCDNRLRLQNTILQL